MTHDIVTHKKDIHKNAIHNKATQENITQNKVTHKKVIHRKVAQNFNVRTVVNKIELDVLYGSIWWVNAVVHLFSLEYVAM